MPADFPAHQFVDLPHIRVSRWYGPGRVLACETKLEEDGITRARTTIVWFIAQGRLKKAHSSQLRHASERKKEIAEATLALTMPWTLSQGQFEDLTAEAAVRPARGRSATPARGRSGRGVLARALGEPIPTAGRSLRRS